MPTRKTKPSGSEEKRKKKKQAAVPVAQPEADRAEPDAPTEPAEEVESGIFPVVGVGASAGGLEAFTELLQNLPSDTGMAFVFVPHLDPKHVSFLTQLLQRHTSMPVEEATNNLKVTPDKIYIIPRNRHMSLVNGALMLSPRQGSPTAHMPIDPFLRSLAADQKSKAIGIILSGNASDGTLGMMAIKAAGGITFAQSGESAKYDGMPRSAIGAGCIDFVLPPKDIAKELARLGQHPYIAPVHAEAKSELAPGTNETIARILSLLRKATGVDFAYYKPTTLQRRILRRMALQRIENLDRYLAKLRSDSAELHALYEDILINVTEFFRDPDVFEALKRVIFPKIIPARRSPTPVRVWVPGCSSGEEVYSIAMVPMEYLGEKNIEVNIQIFGTDISDVALDKARTGVYAPGLVEGISPERIRRFFRKSDANYAISKSIREMCVFAKRNLIRDPPFSKIDLISCRNVLIYLGAVLQKRLIPVFHYALKPTGFLLLGSSETIGSTDLFSLIDKKNKIYSRLPAAEHLPLEFPSEEGAGKYTDLPRPKEDWTDVELAREADRIVLGKYAPSGVVIDSELNILQFRGRTSPYLELPSGAANLNLLAMAREGLGVELRAVLHKARREGVAVQREGVRVRRESGVGVVNIEVIPFRKSPGRESRFLVLFTESRGDPLQSDRKTSKRRLSAPALERQNSQLRQELIASKEYLQSVIEQHDTSNEELRSANEEIRSSNEELQSTNEELETAKEELQSTNEEVNTVNEELQIRNLQLAQAGNDLLNLLSNVNIPIIMVGNDLRIRRFTPVSQKLLNLIPTDVGRPISDINLKLEIPRLEHLLQEVMETLAPQTLGVKDPNGRPYSLRIRPYRTEDNKIDGAVIVLVDLDPERGLAESLQSEVFDPGDFESLRGFSAGLLVAQERERRHLALELHDDITQRLVLLELGLESLQRTSSLPNGLKTTLEGLRDQVNSLSDRMRNVAHQLHPSMIDDLGLVAALEVMTREFNANQGLKVTFQHDDVPGKLDRDLALSLYRVAQEALHNVVKHSGSKSAQLTIKRIDPDHLRLAVIDAGAGFEPDAAKSKGLGLRSMDERIRFVGGTLSVSSHPGKGTEITVTVPLHPGGGEEKALKL